MQPLKDAKPTKESIIGCEGCPYKTGRVGGRGPFDSPFVIVGESPGAAELAKGVPFVGPSGRMMKEVLEEVGFDDLGVEPYITNALSCYPVDKDLPSLKAACGMCQTRLREELLAHPREVILCLGAAASWAVTGDYSIAITRDRGKVLKSNLATKGVVLAVHPAYLMRNGGGLPFWKKDLQAAVDLMKGTLKSYWQEPTFTVIDSRDKLEAIVASYISADYIAADYETDGLSALFNRVLCLGITKDGVHVDLINEDTYYANLDLVKELMEHPHPRWIWQNGKFDIQFSWASRPETEELRHKHGFDGQCNCCAPEELKALLGGVTHDVLNPGVNARVDEDTMLMSYAMNENQGFHDLDQIAQSWIQAPAHKGVMDKYYKMAPHKSLRNAPLEELYQYCAYDLAKTWKMFFPLEEALLEDQRLVNLYRNTLIRSTPFFARIETQGVRIDKKVVERNIEEEDKLIAEINERLQQYALEHMGREINFRSWQQVRELIWKHLKLGPPGSEKGRNWFTTPSDEDALIDAQRRTNHPILHDMLEHREVTKRKGTYVINIIDHYKVEQLKTKVKKTLIPGLVKPDNKIHPSFLIHGTQTGRPACRNPNILNVPRDPRIRNQYVAAPGKCFVEVDLSQAELRSLAILSRDPLLMEIYTKNEISIHDVTTSAFFASKEEMAENPELMHKAADLMQYFGERTPGKVYAEAKMAGKTINFGIVYGREAPSIAQVFNVSHQEAQRWIDTWLETYAGAAAYIKKCRNTVIANQKMVTPWGRMKRVGVVSSDRVHDLQNQAANFPHQSIAHDILLEAAMDCEERLLHEWDAHPWNEVYDAVYFEIEADDAILNQAIDYVIDAVEKVPHRYGLTEIPFIGEAKVGYRWGSMKDWKGSLAATLGENHMEFAI